MRRSPAIAVLGLMLCVAVLGAQEGIRKGTIKKVDAEKGTLTLAVDGKDHEVQVTPQTRLMGLGGKGLAQGLASAQLKPGTAVFFKTTVRDGKNVLVGLKLVGPGESQRGKGNKFDSSKLKPLTEMGTALYHGHKGGLYPDGKNERPAAHEKAGLALAEQIRPLDAAGKPARAGKIVLLSVGMSNTSQASMGFQKAFQADRDHNPAVAFVNGAQGGMTAARIKDPQDNGSGRRYWAEVDRRLKAAGLTRPQVQVVWIKQADASPSQGFPAYAKKLQEELAQLVQALHDLFPNLKQVYLSSRTYGGYARTPLNPEPYAFESGLSVRWLIERQLKGDPALNYDPQKGVVKAPWLSWGPYLWANGTAKRADGFNYTASDFVQDGTHLTPSGMDKVGRLLLQFFRTDTTARPWFVGRGAAGTGSGFFPGRKGRGVIGRGTNGIR